MIKQTRPNKPGQTNPSGSTQPNKAGRLPSGGASGLTEKIDGRVLTGLQFVHSVHSAWNDLAIRLFPLTTHRMSYLTTVPVTMTKSCVLSLVVFSLPPSSVPMTGMLLT